MRVVLTGICVLAAVVLMIVSATFGFQFTASLGRTPAESTILGAAAVAGDLLKSCLPFFIVVAWRGRRIMFMLIGSASFMFLTVVSLIAAIGVSADVRVGAASARDGLTQDLARIEEERARVMQRLAGQPQVRASSVIEEELARARQDRLWASSKDCVEATLAASRQFCAGYFTLRAELAASIQIAQLEGRASTLQEQAAKLRASGAGTDADPQASLLARLSQQDIGVVRGALSILTAVFIELGSGLGLYLALNHSGPSRAETSAGAIAQSNRPMIETAGNDVADAPPALLALNDLPIGIAQQVERYAVARIVAAPGRRLSATTIYDDYRSWCRQQGEGISDEAAFAREFCELARDIGISRSRGRYCGIACGDTQTAAPPAQSNAARPSTSLAR